MTPDKSKSNESNVFKDFVHLNSTNLYKERQQVRFPTFNKFRMHCSHNIESYFFHNKEN